MRICTIAMNSALSSTYIPAAIAKTAMSAKALCTILRSPTTSNAATTITMAKIQNKMLARSMQKQTSGLDDLFGSQRLSGEKMMRTLKPQEKYSLPTVLLYHQRAVWRPPYITTVGGKGNDIRPFYV